MLLPEKLTPHTLRRTFASLALAAGRDPRWVMGQLGHTDARLTLNVYAQVMQRHRVEEGLIWQLMRFPDEAEERHPGAANETRIETTGRTGATSRGRRDAPANEKPPLSGAFSRWARLGSNQRPLACEARAAAAVCCRLSLDPRGER